MGDDAAWPSTKVSLLLRLREPRDEEAWTLFCELYAPLIKRFCVRRGLQPADASDICQEVLSRVSRAAQRFEYDPKRGKFRSWLATVIHHEIVRAIRSNAPGPHSELTEGDLGATGASLDPEWLDEFHAHVYRVALDRIRPEFADPVWAAFTQVWIEKQAPRAVADALGQTVGWVYKTKFRVLERLKREIEFLAADLPILQRE